jgi:hypothetical protein
MKRSVLAVLVMVVVSISAIGCGDTTKTTRETTVKTPGGTTTVTETRQVEKSGDNPPAANR